MKASCTFLFLIIPFFSIGQFHTSVDFVSGIDKSNLSNQFQSSSNETHGKLNLRFGGNFNVRIFEDLVFKTGLRYASFGYKNKLEDLRWPSEIGPNGWVPDPALPRYYHTIYNYSNVEIPIMARYESSQKKFAPFFEVGFSALVKLGSKTIRASNLGEEELPSPQFADDLKRLHWVAVISGGLNWNVSSGFQIFGQPIARFHLSPFSNPGQVNTIRSFGLEIGVRKTLKSSVSEGS